jgi:hypothetical protein
VFRDAVVIAEGRDRPFHRIRNEVETSGSPAINHDDPVSMRRSFRTACVQVAEPPGLAGPQLTDSALYHAIRPVRRANQNTLVNGTPQALCIAPRISCSQPGQPTTDDDPRTVARRLSKTRKVAAIYPPTAAIGGESSAGKRHSRTGNKRRQGPNEPFSGGSEP